MVKPGIVTPNEPVCISGDHLSRFTFLYVLVVLALWPLVPMLELPCLAIRENTNIQKNTPSHIMSVGPHRFASGRLPLGTLPLMAQVPKHFQTQSTKYAGLSITRRAAGGSAYLNVGGALTIKSLFLWCLFTR
jgi:hypothetical protein